MSTGGSSIGGTLTTGIQDISALLPIIGTEQCEKHVGSALEGGYLYAAATPLSIFGSLGIVKTGISVLVASVSLPRPVFSFTSFKFPMLSMRSSRQRWLGARVLDNAGFKPMGTVAPMIGMDASRCKAETRLLEILEEKHIDNPEKVLINWRIRSWNIGLVICTLIGAALSIVPYIHLILRDISRPVLVPWTFPVLRTVGSSLAVVCCQFLIQSRIVALMKNRVVFMVMNRFLVDHLKSRGEQNPELRLRDELQWSSDLPAEECLWRLKQWLRQQTRGSQASSDASGSRSLELYHPPETAPESLPAASPQQSDVHLPISPSSSHNPIEFRESPLTSSFSEDPEDPDCVESASHTILEEVTSMDSECILEMLRDEEQRQFFKSIPYSRHLHAVFRFASWMALFLSLPAVIAGYIGCFTLVSSSTSRNGPLIWLGLEAALSILRIMLWAANPSFDEKTEVTVEIELSEVPPLVTTEMDVNVLKAWGGILNLVPERQFLEHITPFTGPLPRLPALENSVLYFTLSGTSVVDPEENIGRKRLFMTAFDLSKRTSVTLHMWGDSLVFSDSLITCDSSRDEMQAVLKSPIPQHHSRRLNRLGYFERLGAYYHFTLRALSTPPGGRTAVLRWRWSLSERGISNSYSSCQYQSILRSPPLTAVDRWYLERGYEHFLKTRLTEKWGKWIAYEMDAMQRLGQIDCYYYLADPHSWEAKQEIHLLVHQLLHELFRREMAHLELSGRLEDILSLKIEFLCQAADRDRPGEWHLSELKLGRRKRLQEESELARERMNEFIAAINKIAHESEILDDIDHSDAQILITQLWVDIINEDIHQTATHSRQLQKSLLYLSRLRPQPQDDHTMKFSTAVLERFSSWKHFNQVSEMNSMIERIRNASFDELTVLEAYQYEEPSYPLATAIHSKFLSLPSAVLHSSPVVFAPIFVAKHSSPMGAEFRDCSIEIVREVVRKCTCHSVLEIGSAMIEEIPKVNHLFHVGREGEDITPPFALQNRTRWWQEAERNSTNSSIVYFTGRGILWYNSDSSAWSMNGTAARIMIYIHFPVQPRLRLVHHPRKDIVTVSIMECGKQLHVIQNNELPIHKLGILDIELSQLERGKHELEVVVASEGGEYYLRDIVVDVSVDMSILADGGGAADTDSAPMVGENTDADADGRISDRRE